jgi:hypothetical protein
MPKLQKAWGCFLLTFNMDQKFLQRFKVAHNPLVKTFSSFENMENHGESIKLIFH